MDLNRIKKKLDQFSSGGGSSDLLWRPKEGKQTVRIVPYKHDPEWPFIELQFYYKLVKGKTIVSPMSFGNADPVVEFAEKLKTTGKKEDWIAGQNLLPKIRIYAPVIVRGEEDEGVKFWGFGPQVYTDIMKTIDDPDYGDITDLKNGRDITIEYEKKPGEKWPTTTLRVKPNISRAVETAEHLEYIKNVPNLKESWKEPSYEELKEYLRQYLETDNSSDNDEDEEETTTPKKSTKSKKTDDDEFLAELMKGNAKGEEAPEEEVKAAEEKQAKEKAAKKPDAKAIEQAFESFFND